VSATIGYVGDDRPSPYLKREMIAEKAYDPIGGHT